MSIIIVFIDFGYSSINLCEQDYIKKEVCKKISSQSGIYYFYK